MLARLTNLFPVWVLVGGTLALVHPPGFTWFTPYIVPGLAVIMLGMGLTLTLDDFRHVVSMPRAVAVGFAAQFTLMPLLGWSVARWMNLPIPLAVGLILVSCCPGGTASNIVAYLARAHVALSVVMTLCSTFGAILLTPLLTKGLAGSLVPVDAWRLFLDTVRVVLLPVIAGVLLNRSAPGLVRRVLPVAPLLSVLVVAMICASIIGQSSQAILESGGRLLVGVLLLHVGGFAAGYALARVLGYDVQVSRTVSIEVGMQNSGLGVVLARGNFADPLTAVPCAISSVFHSVIGSLLAGLWRLRPVPREVMKPLR
ncbi:MAG: bile acid:sodium symporter family protein [Verrucomicrobiae bacterium]|nr:bile acid:sodium symporter family protein [Verrucomicrobiae bacterium]